MKRTFNENEHALRISVRQAFAEHGFDARIDRVFTLEVPPSSRRVEIRPHGTLTFNDRKLRSEHWGFMDPSTRQAVRLQTPICLPVEVKAYDLAVAGSDISSAVRWRDVNDNNRISAMAVALFLGQKQPSELALSARECFVVTAIFGETSQEVSILRRWRDERLIRSAWGRILIDAYNVVGPRCAAAVKRHPFVARMVRRLLKSICCRIAERYSISRAAF